MPKIPSNPLSGAAETVGHAKPAEETLAVKTLILKSITDTTHKPEFIIKALGSEKRLDILNYLGSQGCSCSVLEISEALHMPFTTTTQHIKVLERAGLIQTAYQPSTRGLKKVCTRSFDQVLIQLLPACAVSETG